MSTTTDVLSLFKYDPVADADSTFNITQALNNNWDKLDAAILLAIAAAGAYNPEESYAVGDYCTYKGKLRKCSTAIPTGEAWTEAHWTTTTVAAEMAELSSQLSNAAKAKTLANGYDIKTLAEPGLYMVIDPTNAPSGTKGWHAIEVNYAGENYYLKAYVFGSQREYSCRRRYNEEWGAWVQTAIVAPPQAFDLPITAGYEDQIYQNTYCKTQDGIVHVSFCIRKTTSTAFDPQEVFATLPAGFRPSSELARDVGGDGINLGNGIVATEIHIRTNGEMYMWGVNSQINWVYGEVSFRAAD